VRFSTVITQATRPAPAAARKTAVKALPAGSSWPSTSITRPVATAANTALHELVPSIRIRVFRLFAAAVSDAGTAFMMIKGMAE
jgi:hypothetical protein